MPRRVLYMLIEEADRELKSRALITAIAIERGFDVVLMPQWTAWQNWGGLPPGVILFKGNNSAQKDRMAEAKRYGHLVASIEEEVLGVVGPREIQRCYAPGLEDVCDVFLANGPSQADLLKTRFPMMVDAIYSVGNPRIDLLQDAFMNETRAAAEELRRRHGDFVLVNTNFSSINPRGNDTLGYFDTCIGVGVIDAQDPEDLDDFFTWCSWERTNLRAVGEFVREAHRRSPWPLIVRPHPTEDLAIWTEMLAGMDGVRVIREGDHLAWTAAARALVHPGCTTGSEALLLGTPAVSLVVDDNPWHGLYLSNLVNPTAASVDTAWDLVADLADGGDLLWRSREECFHRLKEHVETGPKHLSALAMTDVFDAMPVPYVSDNQIADLGALRPVASTEGKIDSKTFAPGPVLALISSYRKTLGYTRWANISEPIAGVLHCPPIDLGGGIAR
jgi:surface carbohydrate biosynthesis protein